MARVEVWECHGYPVQVKCAFIVPAARLESDATSNYILAFTA
jgi:hypothetical protein